MVTNSGFDAGCDPGSGRDSDRGVVKPLVLVVEDDQDASSVARSFLTVLGLDSVVASDALEALTWLSEHRPDLILLDICLPGLDGVDFARVVRRVEHLRSLPIIAASGVYPRGSKQLTELRRLGVTNFLTKPFSMTRLRSLLALAMPEHVTMPSQPPGRSIGGRVDLHGRQRPVRLVSAASRQMVLTGDGAGPEGGVILPIEFDCGAEEVVVLGRVLNVVDDGGRWRAELQVEASRPSDGLLRVAALLD